MTTVACFAAGHRASYKKGLVNMDVSYWKLCRQIVGPPPQIRVSTGMKYHEILHLPNERLEHFATLPGANSWSQCVYAHIIKNLQRVWRASLQTDGLNVCKIGFLLGPAIPDVLHRVGIKKWFPILDTEIFEIGWTLLTGNTGAIFIWTTSSTSAGFDWKVTF